jgi:hypothetical protein
MWKSGREVGREEIRREVTHSQAINVPHLLKPGSELVLSTVF